MTGDRAAFGLTLRPSFELPWPAGPADGLRPVALDLGDRDALAEAWSGTDAGPTWDARFPGDRRVTAERGRAGVRWDPKDFRGAYDAAAVSAALGRDGRAEAQRANRLNRLGPYSNWLPYWLEPSRGRPPRLIGGLAPLLLGGEPYPPILRPYARPPA